MNLYVVFFQYVLNRQKDTIAYSERMQKAFGPKNCFEIIAVGETDKEALTLAFNSLRIDEVRPDSLSVSVRLMNHGSVAVNDILTYGFNIGNGTSIYGAFPKDLVD